MNTSMPSLTQVSQPQTPRIRPKSVTTYLVLSLVVTSLAVLVYLVVGTPLGGLKLPSSQTVLFFMAALINLGCLVATIALFSWRKWAALAFYGLLGLLLLWYGFLFLIQEGINLTNIAGFFTFGILPLLIFQWVIRKIWSN